MLNNGIFSIDRLFCVCVCVSVGVCVSPFVFVHVCVCVYVCSLVSKQEERGNSSLDSFLRQRWPNSRPSPLHSNKVQYGLKHYTTNHHLLSQRPPPFFHSFPLSPSLSFSFSLSSPLLSFSLSLCRTSLGCGTQMIVAPPPQVLPAYPVV